MNTVTDAPARLIENELDLLAELVPLQDQKIIELGCGAAALARELVRRFPGSTLVGLEVDERQHAKNLAAPQDGITFAVGGAQQVPYPDGSFDLALMLKSLHHVPMPLLATALGEVARVLRPGGHLYSSEPVYAGALNEIIRVFNDEGVVRAAAQRALDDALRGDAWTQVAVVRFESSVRFASFDEFERRHMRPTFADHKLDDAKIAATRAVYERYCDAEGRLAMTRPNLVRLLRRR